MTPKLRLAVLVSAATLGTAGSANAAFYSISISTGFPPDSVSGLNTFNFSTPSEWNDLGVRLLGGISTAQAGTAGGRTFFTPDSPTVALDLATVWFAPRGAYLASTDYPAEWLPQFGLSPIPPLPGRPLPADATTLALHLSDPAADGFRTLTVTAIDDSGAVAGVPGMVLAYGSAPVRSDGWWAVNIWTPPSVPSFPPFEESPGTDPWPPPVMEGPPSAATPEPATLALVALGLPVAGMVRGFRRRK